MSEQNGAGGLVIETIAHTLEDNTSRKVFGEPVTVGEVTLIPAARVIGRGGGGGGGAKGHHKKSGEAADTDARNAAAGEGSGGGMVQSARPVGAFVVKGNGVTWRPAIDVNRLVLGGQIVAIAGLLLLRTAIKHGMRHRSAWHRSRRIHRHRRQSPIRSRSGVPASSAPPRPWRGRRWRTRRPRRGRGRRR